MSTTTIPDIYGDVVKGIRVQLSTDQFREHLQKRAEYHKTRAQYWLTRANEEIEKARQQVESSFDKAKQSLTFEQDQLDQEEQFANVTGTASIRYAHGGGNNYNIQPGASEMQNSRQHRQKYAYFTFMAEYLIPDKTYQLEESDLTKLELIANYL